MKQYESVIKVMEENDSYSTLGFLYQNVDVSKWITKTPFASIRRIVQDKRYFFKIRPGLWALLSRKEEVLRKFNLLKKEDYNDFTHYYYQGLIVEIGNMRGYKTYVPPQDKNKKYLNKKLKDITKIPKIFNFSYLEIVNRAKTIDVIWFNDKKLPACFFEIENSTNFQNSLLKYYELKDFHSQFYIVSPFNKSKEFINKINMSAFKEIKHRVKFVDYNFISNYHSKSYELSLIGSI